jgi:nucleoside-diphosphate-sugar epimerase
VFNGRTAQFIFCSTVDVYSKTPCSYPIRETDPLGASPGFPYGYKKMLCERLLWDAQDRGAFALTVFRPAATYHDAGSPGVHSFGSGTYHLDRLLKAMPIILHGDGASIWVATHRDDASVPFANAAGNPAAYGQAYLVTGDEWMTQNHIWRTIARAIGAPEPDFVYIPTSLLGALAPLQAEWCMENFQHNNLFDNSKVKRDLGFRYTIRYEEGVARCFEYLKRHHRIESCENYPFYDRLVERWRAHRLALIAEFRSDPV